MNIPSPAKELTVDLNVLKFYFVISRLNRFHYSHRFATIPFSDSDANIAALVHAKSEIISSTRRTENAFGKNDCGRRHDVDTVW